MIGNEQVIDKITTDLHNKKIIIRGEDNSTIVLKCSTINEFCELLDKCKKLLKTDTIICR
jgi:hypothetical protein